MSEKSVFRKKLPAFLLRIDQSRRTKSIPFTSRVVCNPSAVCPTTFSAAYFFFFNSSMRLNT